jgi:hypothetical protein
VLLLVGIDEAVDSPRTLASEAKLFCELAWLSVGVGVGLSLEEMSPGGTKCDSMHSGGRRVIISVVVEQKSETIGDDSKVDASI